MNADLNTIAGSILIFSIVSMIFILGAYIFIGATNDYVLFNLQETADYMYNNSLMSNQSRIFLQETGDNFTDFNFRLDDWWLLAYIVFIISSFYVAYRIDSNNYYTFFGMLFYGLMFFLLVVTILSTITDWFRTEILMKLFPTASLLLPKFYYYIDHVGLFSAIQFAVCLLINMLDFDLSGIRLRRKQEKSTVNDEEEIL